MIYLDKGYIGCFEMTDKDSGKRRLEEYVRQLTDAGHKRIIAPINGDTWRQYRLVSWSNGDAPFPLEPQNPLWYNEVFEECGFRPLKKYRSDKFSIENIEPIFNTDSARDALKIRGFRDDDLRLIYDISLRGFNRNFLYSDITFEEFSGLYQPILPMFDKELAIIAEVNDAPAGFVFSFAVGDTLIIKTIAVLPEYRSSKSVGAKMISHVLAAGRRKGAKTAIGALIAEGNNSLKLALKYGSEQIREYTLYCLEVLA